jgi:hypothetical protein
MVRIHPGPLDKAPRLVAGSAHWSSRDYLLYAVLDGIEKLAIAIAAMGWDEIVGTEEIRPLREGRPQDRHHRTGFELLRGSA